MRASILICSLLVADLPGTNHAGQAKAFVELMSRGEFAKAVEPFDEAMQKAMPADKLKETWAALIEKIGAFKEATGTRSEMRGKYEMIFVTCTFEKMKLDLRVAFDTDHKISG